MPPLLASLALLLALRPQSHHQIRKRALLRRLRLVPPLLASLALLRALKNRGSSLPHRYRQAPLCQS